MSAAYRIAGRVTLCAAALFADTLAVAIASDLWPSARSVAFFVGGSGCTLITQLFFPSLRFPPS